jgi:hypothetical protein
MGCYSPPTLKGNLAPRLKRMQESEQGLGSYLDEKTWGSWIVGILHVPMWLHLQSGHSIEPCRTE